MTLFNRQLILFQPTFPKVNGRASAIVIIALHWSWSLTFRFAFYYFKPTRRQPFGDFEFRIQENMREDTIEERNEYCHCWEEPYPGMAIEVSSINPPICAKCGKVIDIEEHKRLAKLRDKVKDRYK